jgi:hypothetical protein
MKKPIASKSILLRICLLPALLYLLLLLAACPNGTDGITDGGDGTTTDGTTDDTDGTAATGDLTDAEASALIYFVYNELNHYAMRVPGNYGSVTVKDDYNHDLYNALYTNDVTVEFDGYADGTNTIDGTGVVGAYMDSADGAYGADYTGTFSGTYDGEAYTLVMDYSAWNDTSGIGSEGTFMVNGTMYMIDTDSDMIFDYFGM